VLNVGAGAGSYEPANRRVVAVEPSWETIQQRPTGAAPAVRAVAETLPFADATFDATLAVLTVHHWSNLGAGLAELRRVSRWPVVLTWDQAVFARFWLATGYLPEIAEYERALPGLAAVRDSLDPVRVPPTASTGWSCGRDWSVLRVLSLVYPVASGAGSDARKVRR
jgi:SAM-dependent methyltransferase